MEPQNAYIRSINPGVLCNTFQACVSALARIASDLERQGQDTNSAINAQGIYQMYIEEIKKQMTYGLNSISIVAAPPFRGGFFVMRKQ